MKKLLLIVLPILFIVGCSKPVEDSTLINKDGLMYLPDSDSPYSGEVFTNYNTGEKLYTGIYENGSLIEYSYLKKDGSIKTPINDEKLIKKDKLVYDPNYDETYNGEVVMFYDTGEKLYFGTYKNGVLIQYSYLNKDGSVKEPVNGETLIKRSGLFYTVNGQKPYTGDVFELYRNGSKKYTGSIKGGKKNKLWTEWYRNGQKEYEGTYKDGKKDGSWTEWYRNGQKDDEGTYKDGKKDGLWTEWYENGQKKYEETYKDGKKDGLWTEWYENGQKRLEITYKNGEKDLWLNYWTGSGNKQIDEGNGKITNWYENGQKKYEETYKDGKFDGLWTMWYKNGQKYEEETYKDGKKDGKWTKWYRNGKKESEGIYKDGKKDGLEKKWWDDRNRIDQTTYKDGKTIREWMIEDEILRFEQTDYNGEKDYLYTSYHSNGQKEWEVRFINNNMEGIMTKWYTNGQMKSKTTYINGKEDWYNRKEWNKDGSVKE